MFGNFFGPPKASERVDDSGWGAQEGGEDEEGHAKQHDDDDDGAAELTLALHVPPGAAVGGKSQAKDAFGSISIRRITEHERTEGTPSTTENLFVPPRCLAGLLPEALLARYQLWRVSGSHVIRGVRPSMPDGDAIVIKLLKGGARACVDLHAPSSVACRTSDGTAHSSAQLVDLLHTSTDSLRARLAALLSRIENLSHILCWGVAGSAGSTKVELTLVELPRLSVRVRLVVLSASRCIFSDLLTRVMVQLRLKPKLDDNGTLRLFSLDHDGLFISDLRGHSLKAHLRGIPHALVLANTRGQQFLLVPSFGLRRPRVRPLPFSTHLVPHRSTAWMARVRTRTFLYPVHASGSPPLCASVPAFPTDCANPSMALCMTTRRVLADFVAELGIVPGGVAPAESRLPSSSNHDWYAAAMNCTSDAETASLTHLDLFCGCLYQRHAPRMFP